MYGYATDETKEMMPLSLLLAHQLLKCAASAGGNVYIHHLFFHQCIYITIFHQCIYISLFFHHADVYAYPVCAKVVHVVAFKDVVHMSPNHRKLDDLRRNGTLSWAKSDGKSQVP